MPTRSEMATRGAETRARIIELGGLALGLTLAYLTQRAGLWDIPHLMQLKDALVAAFTEGKEFELGNVTAKEQAAAEKLAKERYSSDEWNNLR